MGKRTPSGLRLYFDNCFPSTLARALASLDGENEYEHLQDRSPENTDDVDWIRSLDPSRIVVSGDGRILRKPIERDAWIQSRLRGFFLSDTFPNKPLWEQVAFVVQRWERLLYTAARCAQGATHMLPWGKGLKIEIWVPPR